MDAARMWIFYAYSDGNRPLLMYFFDWKIGGVFTAEAFSAPAML
jgi:hypothetical protein